MDLLILLSVLVLILILAHQMRARTVKVGSLILSPVLLIYVTWDTLPPLPITRQLLAILFLIVGLLVGVGRGKTLHVFRDTGGRIMRCGTWSYVLLWLVVFGTKMALRDTGYMGAASASLSYLLMFLCGSIIARNGILLYKYAKVRWGRERDAQQV